MQRGPCLYMWHRYISYVLVVKESMAGWSQVDVKRIAMPTILSMSQNETV